MATLRDILEAKGAEVVALGADEAVLDAARLMNERGIGGVMVTDGDRLAGIFTERDILRRVVGERRDPATTPVREVMTTPVITVLPETTIAECMAIMTGKRVRHLPVEDSGGVCGLVTSGDVLAYQVREHEDTIQYLNSYMFDLR